MSKERCSKEIGGISTSIRVILDSNKFDEILWKSKNNEIDVLSFLEEFATSRIVICTISQKSCLHIASIA